MKVIRCVSFVGSVLAMAGTAAFAADNARYLSALGSDLNDGRTPETAWRTIEKLNRELPAGGTAYLRCGDVFYGTIEVKGGLDSSRRTIVTSFGDGPKPIVSRTKNIKNDPGLWRTDSFRFGSWYMDLANPSNYAGVATDNANPGFLLVDGEVKPWRHFCHDDINRQWDFAGEGGRLYVYSTNNPALLARDIRVAVDGTGILIHSHTAVSNIAVHAVGGHGICAGWYPEPTVDMRISDCYFENIGGAELLSHKSRRVRYGNAVEFGSNCADAIVERCKVKGVYDVAFTMQGTPTSTGWNDIHIRNCHVEDSSQAFEIWCKKAAPGMGFTRCSFTGNRTYNVGGGWGALSRPNRAVATPLLVYRMETEVVDITIADNTFEKNPLGLIFVLDGVDTLPSGYRMLRNTIK